MPSSPKHNFQNVLGAALHYLLDNYRYTCYDPDLPQTFSVATATAAAVATSSSEFRNSSLGPNLLSAVSFNDEYVSLFSKIFFNSLSSSTLQFSPTLKISRQNISMFRQEVFDEIHQFVTTLISSTPYFCKSLKNLVIDVEFDSGWKSESSTSDPYLSKFLTCFDRQVPHLNSLTFKAPYEGITDDAIHHIAKYFPNLTSLDFSGCNRLKDDHLKILSSSTATSGITSLNLSTCNDVTSIGIQHLASSSRFENLQTLDFSRMRSFSNKICEIVASPSSFPNLTELDILRWTPEKMDDGLSVMCDPQSSHLTQTLRTLKIGGDLFSSDALKKLRFLQNLKSLHVRDSDEFNDEVVVSISTSSMGRTLETLFLRSGGNLSKTSFDAITKNMCSLKKLSIYENEKIDKEVLLWIGTRLQNLTSLEFVCCSCITDAGIKCLFTGVDSEKNVDDDAASTKQDPSLQQISPVAKTLVTFFAGWASHLTDESLICIAATCLKLEEFSYPIYQHNFTQAYVEEFKRKLVK